MEVGLGQCDVAREILLVFPLSTSLTGELLTPSSKMFYTTVQPIFPCCI